MPIYQVRNKKTKVVLGEVTVDDPELILDKLAEETGTTIEDIAQSLGQSVEQAKAALDIIVLREPAKPSGKKRIQFPELPRRGFYA